MSTQQEDIISSLYPPPPPYYRFFTKENVTAFEAWKRGHENDMEVDDQDKERADLPLPSGELKLFIPPKPPAGPYYHGFGNLWSFEDKLPSLKELGWTQLYGDDEVLESSQRKTKELHKLVKSLLLNFLELVGVVSVDPQQFHLKIEDIKLILININHILNSYRPHQSRESLIMLLRKQIDLKKKDIDLIENVTKDIKTKISDLMKQIAIDGETESSGEQTQLKDSIRLEITNHILDREL